MSADRFIKARTRSSNVGTVVGITLVLFMLGLLGFLLLNARQLEQHFKENVQVDIVLERDLKEVELMKLRKKLDTEPYARATRYVTPEEAAEQLKVDLGDDFLGPLGENPLRPTIILHMAEGYASPDSLRWIADDLRKQAHVHQVAYNPVVVENIADNMSTIRLLLLVFSGLLLVIAVALINNTIRLAIYSKRFLIRTMHLVGATGWFIVRPFIATSVWQGIIASILAIGLLVGSVHVLILYMPDLSMLVHPVPMAILLAGVVVMGILLSIASTWFSVRRYLRMDTDELNWS